MTNEERDMISQFIARVGGNPAGAPPTQWGGSVPATTQPALPPVDPEANALITQAFQRNPEAAYRMTQLAFVQEHALAEAQTRLKRLEWELQQAQQAALAAQQAAQQAPQQQSSGSGGGFFGGLFGGRSQAPPPQQQPGPGPAWNQGGPAPGYQPQYQQAAPPPPQYAPNYQPGMFQRSGSGFLGSALTTAAGVGGGILAADALMNLFSGHHETGGGAFGGGYPAGAPAVESPWGGAAGGAAGVPPGQDYVDQGSWDNSGSAAPSNQDYVDNGTWDQQPTDTSNDDGGGDAGWDAGGGGGGGGSDSLC